MLKKPANSTTNKALMLQTGKVIALSLALLTGAQEGAIARGFSLGRVIATGVAISVASKVISASEGTAKNDKSSPGGSNAPAASAVSCTAQLPGGRTPTFASSAYSRGLYTLCFQEYTVAFSEKNRTPLWSAEYLTKARIEAARSITRVNTFHEEDLLPSGARSHLKSFVRSGYDRGHMSPSGDMSSSSAQNESFSLANIVPQEPNNNRRLWEGIESGTRNYAIKNGSVYVITGPLFSGKIIGFLNNEVAIPTQLFKLLYDPIRKAGGVFLVDNIDTQTIVWKSVAEFEQLSGYRFGLGNPPLLSMPKPKQYFSD